MDSVQTYSSFSTGEKPKGGESGLLEFTDPWADQENGRRRRDTWMLSYIDMLTLLLTLFVLLLVLQPKQDSQDAKDLSESVDLTAIQTTKREPRTFSQNPNFESEQPLLTVESSEGGSELALPIRLEKGASAEIFEPVFFMSTIDSASSPTAKPPTDEDSIVKTAEKTKAGEPSEKRIDEAREFIPDKDSETVKQPAKSNTLDVLMAKLSRPGLDERLKVSQKDQGIHLEVRDNVLFAEGSAELKPEGLRLLGGLADVLLQHPGIIWVEGHTDNKPISSQRFPSNWELSSGRATTVTRYLIGRGLDSSQLRAVGYADTRPLESNATPEGRARNRRVSLILEFPKELASGDGNSP